MTYINDFFTAEAIHKFLVAVILLVIGVLAIRIMLRMIKKTLSKSKLEKAAHTLIVSISSVVLYILLGLSVASALGIDVTGVVAVASVLTLSLSLALQNMLANVIGGVTLLYTHPFRSGDYVEVGGQAGTVREINMSYTMLATPDNKLISIPNSAVVAAEIVNYSIEETRRVAFTINAPYDTPTQKVIDALVLAGSVDAVLLDPAPVAVITEFADSAIQYSLRLWVKTEDYWDVYFGVNQRIKQIFDEQGISMPYPQLSVHLEK